MSQRVQLYEAMYILDSSFEDEEIAAIEERIKAGIESTGGQFESVHEFARRRLAYEIKGHRDGIYRVMYFTGTGETVDELKREFNLAEDIVRGTVLVANPKYMVGKKVAEEAPVAEEGEEVSEEAAEGAEEAVEEVAVEGAEEVVEEAVEEVAVEGAEEVVEEAGVVEAVEEVAAEAAEEAVEEAPAVEEAAAPAEEETGE